MITDEQGAAMARAVVNLFRRWELSDSEACTLLGGISVATYNRWKLGKTGRLGPDLKMRLSLLMGIHKGLRYLFADLARVYAWVKKENAHFGGRSALQVMMQGRITDLFDIRTYLDAVRG
ncbi:MAG: MbcA/ParS/Xre antitoxin family protein [Pseudomonadota bacterium]